MPLPCIKICGITNVEDALLAARCGANALGMNLFSGSRRCVGPTEVRFITAALPESIEPVLLFVNEPLTEVLKIAVSLGGARVLRTIQWHGDDAPVPAPAPWQFIPAFPIVNAASLERVTAYLVRCRSAGHLPAALLLDGYAPGQHGGTGQTVPWHLLADFRPGVPVVLAGGLTADNVAEAIRIVRPYGVDVAGGVESAPGRKDPDKLRRFIDAVRSA
jgi:phosphoribosylanthranilate isomerase